MMRRFPIALLLLLAAPSLARAQYFGQNKVQYRSFDFKIIRTEHFDIHFYDDERAAALDAARMAERSYARLSRILKHEYKERKPIILYASHSDFQQTNALGGESPSEGTGGVTDFLKQRMILPMTGSYEELQHVLTHEMVHQFQYDVWSRGHIGGGLQTIIAVNPPLWFVEGMAEYLSLGKIDPNTAMWLRDAVLNGKLPTIDQLENDPRIFPYRYGQALLAFIGQRWGDEAIGAILQGTLAGGGGLEGATRRVLGVDFRQLTDLWHDAVQKEYLPEVATKQKPRTFAQEILSEHQSQGTLHLAPALSPDGREIAYFSEKNFFFIDLYLADAQTGKVKHRLLKSSYSSNYETFRFINSAASWSPDGKYIAIAAKKGPRDDIIIIDVKKNREARRIKLHQLNGVTTPTFSPDGTQLVFTGYDGGLSDLFTVNVDGTNLKRLTEDKYADLHPVWSPDGKTIAFVTDRGPDTDLNSLRIGNMKLALFHLETGTIEELPNMESGTNRSPQWAPDGKSVAFVSDRTGVSNIFLFDLTDRKLYQLTDLFTGAQGITELSPVISWARDADRLAMVYYEKEEFNVYTVDNPRSLKRDPWSPTPAPGAAIAQRIDSVMGPVPLPPQPGDSAQANPALEQSGSLYRTAEGFRSAGAQPAPGADSTNAAPISITALLDSAELNLPDTTEFTVSKYKVRYQPDYVARPTIGYVRDNFGRGFYGGTAIALSDMLGDHTMIFSGYINGRITEASVTAIYINQTRRINWAMSIGQEPQYFLEQSRVVADSPAVGENTQVTSLRRIVYRSATASAYYPFSRYRRLEGSLSLANVSDHRQQLFETYNASTLNFTQDPVERERSLPGASYVMPGIGYTFDNTLFGYTGPFYGTRYRLAISQAIGGWTFTEATADWRRYTHLFGPFTFATRALFFSRFGRDAERFVPIFLGNTDLVRGNTSGSYYRNECQFIDGSTGYSGCLKLDRLLGTSVAVGNAELRFPILNASLGFLPIGFPPIEGALFYDVGVAWNSFNTLKFNYGKNDDPTVVRTPIQSLGVSFRMNVFNIVILRLDYAIPQERTGIKGLWTLSLGPTF